MTESHKNTNQSPPCGVDAAAVITTPRTGNFDEMATSLKWISFFFFFCYF